LTRAIAIAPNGFRYFRIRGAIFDAKGDLDRAIADYDRALALLPGDHQAQQMRNSALAARAELSRATAAPATAASTAVPSITASPAAPAAGGKPPTSSPSSVQQLLSQASLLMSQGKLDEAIAILNKTVAIDAK